jgi:hypothetical protein
MIRRKLKGNPGCYFCTDLETYEHLFFECQLEEWSGVSLLYASNRMSGHDLMNNSGHRSKLLFLEGRTFTCLVLLLFAGVFGSSGTECVFKRNLLGTPVKSFAPCVFMRYWADPVETQSEGDYDRGGLDDADCAAAAGQEGSTNTGTNG